MLARATADAGRAGLRNVAYMTSARRCPRPVGDIESKLGALGGMWVFGPRELRAALRTRGFEVLDWQIAGLTQFVAGRRSAAAE